MHSSPRVCTVVLFIYQVILKVSISLLYAGSKCHFSYRSSLDMHAIWYFSFGSFAIPSHTISPYNWRAKRAHLVIFMWNFYISITAEGRTHVYRNAYVILNTRENKCEILNYSLCSQAFVHQKKSLSNTHRVVERTYSMTHFLCIWPEIEHVW